MAKRSKTKKRIDCGEDQPPPASPFADLAGLRGELPPGEATKDTTAASGQAIRNFAPKVVLNRQRKGRGGKTVTVLGGVLITGSDRDQFMRELGRALGTNVRGEGDDIVIAGDQRERAKAWLEGRGAKCVIVSG